MAGGVSRRTFKDNDERLRYYEAKAKKIFDAENRWIKRVPKAALPPKGFSLRVHPLYTHTYLVHKGNRELQWKVKIHGPSRRTIDLRNIWRRRC